MEYKKQPPKDFKTTMDYKGDQIKAAQKSKNNAILMAGSARDATLIITSFYANEYSDPSHYPTDIDHTEQELDEIGVETREDAIKKMWKYWRDWLYQQSDVPFI